MCGRLAAVNADFPKIDQPGSFPLSEVRYGPAFAGLIEEQAPARTLTSAAAGSGEVTKTLPGTGKMTIVVHATSQAALDQFVASLTRAKVSR